MKRPIAIGAALLAAGLATVRLSMSGAPAPGAQTTVAPTPAPYAGQQMSSVPGLTEAEIGTLRTGSGMGLARPADLNGYPGPRHVLDLADDLGLSDEQRAAFEALFEQMKAEAVPLGERFLDRYAALWAAFRDTTITTEALQQRTGEIGQVEGELRATHLKYHLLTKPLLTDAQVAAYARLRGYAGGSEPAHHPPGQHGGPGR